MSEERFQSLDGKVDQLIDLCNQMQRENQALRATERSLQSEHKLLQERNQEAKSKLESVLSRLKAMDQT